MNGSYDWWNQILIDEIKYCFPECGFVGNRVDAGHKRAWHAVCSLGFSAKLDVSCGEGVPSTLFEYVVFIVVLIFTIIFAFFIYQIFVKIWSLVKLGALVEIGPCWLSADRWKNKLTFMGDKWLQERIKPSPIPNRLQVWICFLFFFVLDKPNGAACLDYAAWVHGHRWLIRIIQFISLVCESFIKNRVFYD